ncbi:MAG TPA: hypothetical protein VFE42_13240 [Chloroflexota bacterium]|nr:hypothetical protein [Chloroflexota bacterium]
MIVVTQAAKEMFQCVEQPEGQVLRLDVVGPETFGLTLGEARPSDQIVEHEGREVIYIAEEVSQAADVAVLDHVDTPEGPTLVFTALEEGGPAAE